MTDLANVGLTAGFAIGGAYLTALGFFRSDARIALEEATYADGGDTRVAGMMQSARLGRLGVVYTAISVMLAPLANSPASLQEVVLVAAGTTALLTGSGRFYAWAFWQFSRDPRVSAARQLMQGK